jgi:hypothetical protein
VTGYSAKSTNALNTFRLASSRLAETEVCFVEVTVASTAMPEDTVNCSDTVADKTRDSALSDDTILVTDADACSSVVSYP